jgi:dihydroflavonol-4-reductase
VTHGKEFTMSGLNLVTGANGHLGNNLVRALLDRGDRVRGSVRDPEIRAPFDGLDCEVVQADLLDRDALLRALEGVHTLYHVAAVVKHWSLDPREEIILPNVEGTRNILQAASNRGVARIVYVSSEITLDDRISPVDESSWRTDDCGNPYARAKTDAERLAWELAGELGLNLVSVLPGTIVGPFCHRLTPTMKYLEQALNGEVFLDINFRFNFVDVHDVVDGMIAAADRGGTGQRYLLATERSLNNRRIIELAQERNSEVKMPPRAPKVLLHAVGGAMELAARLTGKPPMMVRSQIRIFRGGERLMNLSKARSELGYDPRDPETAIRQAFEYLEQRG